MAAVEIPVFDDEEDDSFNTQHLCTIYVNQQESKDTLTTHYENVVLEPIHVPIPMTRLSTRSSAIDISQSNAMKRSSSGILCGNLPELTDHHLLTVFIGSGITYGDINTLGVLLSVPRSRMVIDQPTSHPSWYAMETVLKWVNSEPLALQEAHKKLAKQFRKLDLNSLIPRLHGQERYTAIDPKELIEFLAEETKTFSKEQAYEFGHLLNHNRSKVDAIAQKTGVHRGMDLVVHIFNNFDKESTNLHEPMVDRVVSALLSSAAITSNESIAASSMSLTTDLSEQLQISQMTVVTDGPDTINEVAETTRSSNKEKWKYAGTVPFVIATLLSFITIMCLLFLPTLPPPSTQVIVPSDVILYEIPSSYWLSSLEVELEGPLAAGCYADVISVECNDIQYIHLSSAVYVNEFDYLYIEKDSIVSFTLHDTDVGFCTTPYYAWIFTSIQHARVNSINNFKNLACAQPPENVWCIDLTEMEPFVSPASSYYYIRCDRGPNCILIDTIQVNSSMFDFQSTKSLQIDSVIIYTQESENTLELKTSLINPVSTEGNVCLLMELNENCASVSPPVYQIDITGKTRRYDILLYPVLIFVVIVIIFGVVLCSIIIYYWKCKKLP